MARLPVYLRILYELANERVANVSSERLAELAGVNAAKVRKDLSYLGSLRHPGRRLRRRVPAVPDEPGAGPPPRDWPVVIVGAGNLGQALANYGGFRRAGLPGGCTSSTSTRPRWARGIGDVTVRHLDDLPELVAGGRRARSA